MGTLCAGFAGDALRQHLSPAAILFAAAVLVCVAMLLMATTTELAFGSVVPYCCAVFVLVLMHTLCA